MEKYRVIISWSEEDSAFLAEVPELPGCIADGATQEAALKNAREAATLWIETAQLLGRKIPLPGTASLALNAAESAAGIDTNPAICYNSVCYH